jgi:YegS/Rv2252/BmrU family lipid kinase
MSRRIAVVLNHSSGKGDCAQAAKRLEEVFRDAGQEARITVAGSGEEMHKAMKQAIDDRVDTLAAGGGDGTINSAAQVLVGSTVRLGVIPLGTLNHFAKDLGIPVDVEAAARVILDGHACSVDVGQVNDRIFLNNSSIGVYPAIVRLRERYQASGLGKWIAALWAALVVLRRHPFMAVRIMAEGKEIVRYTPFVFVGNNPYQMAGFHAGTRASLMTGNLAVYVLHAERRVGLLGLAWNVLTKGVHKVKELDLIEVQEATIETRRAQIAVALDGEVISAATPLVYRIKPQMLFVHVPMETSACYPLNA